ncbi:hypothetical protein KKG63_02345, partial [Patescibacteria group bacterium]|nr:hypothetical protein [Patescibacteria group bacterium]
MKYAAFCQYLKQLDQTAKRLEITAILAELINKLPPEEVEKAIFLSLGYLNPPYDQIQFNMADKMVMRALELCYGVSKQKVAQLYADLGDLGDVAGKLGAQKQGTDQSITQVYKELCELALDEGTGSQDRKITGLSDLLESLEPVSAKHTIRVVLGTTRLGFTEKTVIDALSHLLSGDKSVSRAIEEVYNIHPNIAYLARIIKEKGLKGLNSVKLETGVPVLAQKAQRLSDPEDILKKMAGTAWAEYKLDGVRVQLHLDRKKVGLNKVLDQNSLFSFNKDSVLVKTFTRNLEENTYQFPDIAESALKQIQAESIILDGEAVGFDPKTGRYIPFQDMMQRKRKHNVGSYVKQIPLKYIVFDILYLNGQDLTSCSLSDRHKRLTTVIKSNGVLELAEHLETSDPAELWQFFESSKEKNLEGVMIKNPMAPY